MLASGHTRGTRGALCLDANAPVSLHTRTRALNCTGTANPVHELGHRLHFGGGPPAPAPRSSPPVAARSALQPWMTTKPVDSRESPFWELELMELWDGSGKTRVRQHVNPLRRDYQTPPPPPDWAAMFADPRLPLALDIGSGYGRFLLLLQRNNPDRPVNYLGVEIRRPLVDRANYWVEKLGVRGRVHYVFANATVSLAALLASYPGPVTDVFIQFPDPHFKRRHHKRRVVQPELVRAVRDLMAPEGRLLLQSDIEEATVAMRDMFERHAGDAFALAPQHRAGAVFHSSSSGGGSGRPTGHSAALPAGPDGDSKCAQPPAAPHAQGSGRLADDAGSTSAPAAPGAAATSRYAAVGAGAAQPAAPEAAALTQPRTAAAGGSCCGSKEQGHAQSEGSAVGASSAGTASDNAGAGVARCRGSTDGESGSEDGADNDSDSGGEDDSDADGWVSEWAAGGWLVDNPVGTPTEREHYVGQQGLPVYRVLLVRG